MNKKFPEDINDRWIVENRGDKNLVDSEKPYGWLVEKERTPSGRIEDTAIIFLTNSECPFHCLMCDLWKNTTDEKVKQGAIPGQIEYALERMAPAKHIKLYNSGSFFDLNAIPAKDYGRIASVLSAFETVIVECHPRLVNQRLVEFKNMLKPNLQVAMGLETANRELLRKLNKNMTPEDFRSAAEFLSRNGISSRAFILLRPPFLSEQEGIYWAERSIDYAFDSGVECCTVIPVRGGNGAMEKLYEAGHFKLPEIRSLEAVLQYGIGLKRGRVFADTWDLKLFSKCDNCFEKRTDRINAMNISQSIPLKTECGFC